MFKKIFPLVFIVLFIGVFSYFNGEDFFEYQKKQQNIVEQELLTQGKLEDFSLEKIRELQETQFFYTPYKTLLSKIVKKIDLAEKKVYVEVYMLTESRIKNALIQAKNRGVDVKVILEHSPYLATNLNKKHFRELDEKGINIVWSNSKNYALNHSKIMLIDNELILSSGNFTYSTFAYNRDLFIITSDKSIVRIFSKIFNKDFLGEMFQIYDDNLILSPHYSREKFEKMILGAKRNIKIYAQYLKDETLFSILKKRAEEGVKVEIILSKNGYEDYTEDIIEERDIPILQVQAINNKAKMHSKAILIDEKYLFIGSVNFSTSSIDKNREMGLLLNNKTVIEKFLEVFDNDK